MYRLIFFIACILLISTSCKELYTPEIENGKMPLVVDGCITDEAKPYSIKLSKALPYDNNYNTNEYNNINEYKSVSNAMVTVSDDCGHTYKFTEFDYNGVYMSDPSEFVGVPGRSYTLFIKTADNQEYRSAPQLLLPNDFNVKVDAEFGTKDELVDDGSGTFYKKNVDGVNLLYTIKNNEDTFIRFRFDHKLYAEYVEGKVQCWAKLLNSDNINITYNYGTSTNDIEKHNVCFMPHIKFDIASGDTKVVFKLITKIIQYRLNSDTYQFYKNNYTILAATGKIFDPISSKVKGNVTCISDNSEALGFFEASSARIGYYAISNGSNKLEYIKSYEPPYDFGCPKGPPDFWVY